MKLFYGCSSAKEAKEIYHKLAKCFHPDKGGSNELMVELKKQYETWDEPVIASNAYSQMYTPNNFGFSPGRFNQTSNFENQRLKEQVSSLQNKLEFVDKLYLELERANARLEDDIDKLQDTIDRLTQQNYNLSVEKAMWPDQQQEIKDLEDRLKKQIAANETFTNEIARLTKLKEPKTIIDKFKEYISA